MTFPNRHHDILAPAMRPVLLIPLFGAALILALWVAVVTLLALERDSTRYHALHDAESYVAGFEEHAVRALADVERTAFLVKREFERDGSVDLPGLMRAGLIPEDDQLAVSVADRAGRTLSASGPFGAAIDIADRDYFRAHVTAKTGQLYISKPVTDPVSGRTAILMSRRLDRSDGSFGGVVVVAVDPRYFTDFYQDHYLGERGVLSVVGTDGTFRARRVGGRVDSEVDGSRTSILARARAHPVGSYVARSGIDNITRLFAYRRLRDYPLIVAAGRAESEVLTGYETHRLTYTVMAVLASLAIVGFFSSGTVLFYRLRRSQDHAQKTEALFRAAADGGLDAFALLHSVRDPDGRIVDFVIAEVNPRAAALTGATRGALIGKRLSAVLRHGVTGGLLAKYIRVAETGEPLEEAFAVDPLHEAPVWIRHQVVRALDGIALTARDITEQKRNEEELHRQTSFLRALIENLPLGVMVRSALPESIGRILLWNQACEYMYGLKESQTVGRTFRDLVDASYADRVEASDRAMLASPMVQEVVHAAINTPHHGRRFLNFIRAPILAADDRVEYIISIATDVTDEKARHDELRLASKVFATTADAVLLSDAEDRVIMVNQAFTDVTGFTATEVRGQPVQELPFGAGHLDHNEAFTARLKGEGRLTEERLQYRKDGSSLYCLATASCVLDDEGEIAHYVRVFTDISALKASQQQLEELANFDTLTGLPNRRLFQDRLERALQRARRTQQGVALLFIDLDGFKEVNDTIGHDVGDLLLCEVSERLVASVRASDSVCRLGGDEFTVIVEDATLPPDAIAVAERILTDLAAPFTIAGHRLFTSASVGIAIFPGDGSDATTLVRNADVAMYRAKKLGRNRYEMFAPPVVLGSELATTQ